MGKNQAIQISRKGMGIRKSSIKFKMEMKQNWKQKWEQITHHSLMQCFVGVRVEPGNDATCSVLCDYLFSVIKLV